MSEQIDDRKVSAAFFRLMGATQHAAGTTVGVSARTVRQWEREPDWRAATEQARDRWINGITDEARSTISRAIRSGDTRTAKWLLERLDPNFTPPRQRHELSGPTGGPIRTESGTDQQVQAMLSDPDLRKQAGELALQVAKRIQDRDDGESTGG